jgi:sterol desaturase/sphingolipid hydroxylase (fatty acid hydroxylase superfamily)
MSNVLLALPDAPPAAQVRVAAPARSVRESRVRLVVAVTLILLGASCLALRLVYPYNFLAHQPPGSVLHWLAPRLRKVTAGWSVASMVAYPIGMLAIFSLERLFPADPAQKTFSTGLIHDGLWELATAINGLVLVRWFGGLLFLFYARHLSFLTLPFAPSVPALARLAIGAVVVDLLRWIHHWLYHHVPWLWAFHAVHHSQEELNLFSDRRIHFLEYFSTQAVLTLPMLMLGLNAPDVIWWVLFLVWHARLEHANIRTNYGFLRYLIVTPQGHRVHHSKHPKHFDRNFGAFLSIWDYLFGTQYRHYDEYPDTGVDDEKFPAESATSLTDVLAAPLRQTVYPFRYLWRMMGSGKDQ